jgi:oxalate decarboxylase/phosphoglucose isomerase-like protein (cupin superfamily)
MEENRAQGFAINAAEQIFHEMSDKNDPEFQRGGGNTRDEGRWKGLIVPSTVGPSNMIMGIYSLRPGETHLLHYHESAAEYYYILTGTGAFTLGDRVIRGEPGLTLYMPAKVNHAITNDGDEDLSMIFCFDRGDLKDAKCIWV